MNKNHSHYNPHLPSKEIKKALGRNKDGDDVNYKLLYNEINYISPGVHLNHYYPTCISLLKEGDKWLDVGCGCAKYIKKAITDKNIDLHGMDVVDKSIEQASKNGVKCIKNSASDPYPYDDESFDMVTSTDVLEHLHPSDVDQALEEIFRVLKKQKFALLAPAVTMDKTGLLHLTVKPTQWWISKFEGIGFKYLKRISPKGLLLHKEK